MRKFSFTIILLLFVLFSIFVEIFENKFEVLEIYSPSQIIVDFNKNKKADNEEILNLKVKTKTFNSEDEKFVYDYFAKEYAKNLLLNKKVKYDKSKNDIYFDNQSYIQTFNNHDIQIGDIENYRILNTKSNKYHNINCKYGRQSHNYIIVKKSDITKNIQECKYCKTISYDTKDKSGTKSLTVPIYDTGDIRMYLTDFTNQLRPDNSCRTNVCQMLKYHIDSSKNTIDMAIYGFENIPQIKEALINAQNRGVKLRMVYDTDSDNNNYYRHTLDLANIVKNTNTDNKNQKTKSFIMHNKFIIFDNKRVYTGSANISPSDMSSYNSNVILFIKSDKIAEIYTKEFNQLYSGKFHTEKVSSDNGNIVLGASVLSVYFSPQDNIINTKIIPLINKSKKSIYMPTFLITHKDLTKALINAKQRGVDIKILIDGANANSQHSTHKLLRDNGIDVKVENYAGKMHSKSIIIDEEYLVLGSMNFSKSGNSKNDENVIIIKNPKLAEFYINQFKEMYKKIPDKYTKENVSAESKNSIGSCSDGVDNDFDGKIDGADEGCK